MKEELRNEVYQYLLTKLQKASEGENVEIQSLCNDCLLVFETQTGIDELWNTLPPRTHSHDQLIDFLKADKVMGSLYIVRMVDGAIAAIEAARARKKAKSSKESGQLSLGLF